MTSLGEEKGDEKENNAMHILGMIETIFEKKKEDSELQTTIMVRPCSIHFTAIHTQIVVLGWTKS